MLLRCFQPCWDTSYYATFKCHNVSGGWSYCCLVQLCSAKIKTVNCFGFDPILCKLCILPKRMWRLQRETCRSWEIEKSLVVLLFISSIALIMQCFLLASHLSDGTGWTVLGTSIKFVKQKISVSKDTQAFLFCRKWRHHHEWNKELQMERWLLFSRVTAYQ